MLCMVEVATHNEIMITDDAATLFLFSFTRRTENCRHLRKLLLGDREGAGSGGSKRISGNRIKSCFPIQQILFTSVS